jgi:hypothetical protein
MAQREFDHWWNTLSDPSYAERCRRKHQFRQRKLPIGPYQVDEDVWARHPSDGFMYIASIIAIDRSYFTCRVIFVDDGQTFTLPINHLRHVTLQDIQHNRYIDYGRGWTEHTNTGTIVTYDRYGEQQHVQYTVTPQDVFNYFFTAEESNCIDNDTVDGTPSSIHATEEENYFHLSTNEPIWVKISDPEVPTATYSTCPIWNVSSYAEAEKKALELCNEDIHYREAVQRAQHRIEACKQIVPLHVEASNNSISHDRLKFIDFQSAESYPTRAESPTLTDQPSPVLTDLQLLFDSMPDSTLQPLISIPALKELPAVKLSVAHIDNTNQQMIVIHSQRSMKSHHASTCDAKKIINTHPPKYIRLIFPRLSSKITSIIDKKHAHWLKYCFRHSYVYGFSKHLALILLTLTIVYHLLLGSSLSPKDVHFLPTTTSSTITISVTHSIAMVVFISDMLSSISSGPSRSLFERWHYPFTVP